MMRMTDEQIAKVKQLREKGLSTRQIATRLQIAPATTFYYARDVVVREDLKEDNHQPSLKTKEEALKLLKEKIGTTEGAGIEILEDEEMLFGFFHLPFTLICPHCGKQSNDCYFCFDCGDFFCMGCTKIFDLKTVPRKEELTAIS